MGGGRTALDASLRRGRGADARGHAPAGERRRHEPVRAKLNYIPSGCSSTGDDPDSPLAYREAESLRRDLEIVRDAAGAGRWPTARSRTGCVVRRVRLQLARLDLRLAADAVKTRCTATYGLDGAGEEERADLGARLSSVAPDASAPSARPPRPCTR